MLLDRQAEETRPDLTIRDLAAWRELIESRCGLFFSDGRKATLRNALWRGMNQRFATFADYHRKVAASAPHDEEWHGLVERVVNGETSFFRHEASYRALGRYVLPRLVERGRHSLNIWSVGCSTGEEPYSIAMLARSAPGLRTDVEIRVLGTDLSRGALRTAAAGAYDLRDAVRVPALLRSQFLMPATSGTVHGTAAFAGTGTPAACFQVAPAIRSLVRFSWMNLVEPATYPEGPFDVVFCQNVLIYFREQLRNQVVQQLVSRLAPDGYVIPGPGELAGIRNPGLECLRIEDTQIFARNPRKGD